MKTQTPFYSFAFLILGALLLAAGFFVFGDETKTYAGLCIGIGAGLIGMNIAQLVTYRYFRTHPEEKKRSEVEARDERSVALANAAKARAFDVMTKVWMAVPFLLILADAPLWMTLTVVGLYLFGFGMQSYYSVKYSKEM